MKYYRTLLISMLLFVLVPLWGCESFLGGDVNIDPNKVSEATADATLPPLLTNISSNYFNTAYNTSQVTQHTSNYFSTGPDIQELFRLGNVWSGIYLDGLNNAFDLRDQAIKEDAHHYAGIANIIIAMNLGLGTDNWGDMPFSEAIKGEENMQPAYDKQEDLYEVIQSTLSDAITLLQTAGSTSSPADDDLIYRGNLDNWIKAAHALKARYYIHLTKRDKNLAVDEALSELQDAFESNDDDFQLGYNDRTFNPFHANIVLTNNQGNYYLTQSSYLVNSLDGTIYGVPDPRLPLMADKGSSANYVGRRNGTQSSNSTTDFTENVWYSGKTTPLLMVTYAETKFIEAEALFLQNGGTPTSVGSTADAYQAYLDGIEAHMKKLELPNNEITDYLSDPLVAVGAANLTLGHIMKEKWIALFLNPEAWVDMRRYDYSTDIYKDLTLPERHNPDLNGEWIRRVAYPLDEINRNGKNVDSKALDVKLWWDQ